MGISGLVHSIKINYPFEGSNRWVILRDRKLLLNTVTSETNFIFYASRLDQNFAKRFYTPIHTKMTPTQVRESVYWDLVKESNNIEVEIPRTILNTDTIEIETEQFVPYKKDPYAYDIYHETTFESFIGKEEPIPKQIINPNLKVKPFAQKSRLLIP
jgi:hypothetical protein